jgi:hypothetical protein
MRERLFCTPHQQRFIDEFSAMISHDIAELGEVQVG